MKITIGKRTVRGERMFVVSHKPEGGKRKRSFFKTRTEAETHSEELRLQQKQAGESWMGLDVRERNEIMTIINEYKAKGVGLRQALDAFLAQPNVITSKKVVDAYTDFMAEWKRKLVSHRTEMALKSNVGRFVKLHPTKLVSEVKRQDVLDYLRPYTGRTFNSYLTSLTTFFTWCEDQHYTQKAPTTSIEKIEARRLHDLDDEPAILTVPQCAKLLKATLDTDPGLVPYVACCLFAGLRPEKEAARLHKVDIWRSDNGKGAIVGEVAAPPKPEGAGPQRILVKGRNAKDRQRRLVNVHPVLADWLELGGDMPAKNLRRRFQAVRVAAGLARMESDKLVGWEQDCMRHTFASCSLVTFGEDTTIKAMGHGDYDMLFGHYRALITPEQAAAFWQLTPEAIKQGSLGVAGQVGKHGGDKLRRGTVVLGKLGKDGARMETDDAAVNPVAGDFGRAAL